MELKRALEIRTEYNGIAGSVKCEGDYICLNDLQAYYPNKRIDHWLESAQTKELIAAIEKTLIPGKPGITSRRGYKGGTYAHHLIALDFAAWLSVEFKLKIYLAYIDGTQHKQDWNIKRILAANNYRLMCDAIKGDHEPAKPYHFSNEALMLNEIVFHSREATARDGASEELLDDIAELEADNSTMIKLGMDYQARKAKLTELYAKKAVKAISQ